MKSKIALRNKHTHPAVRSVLVEGHTMDGHWRSRVESARVVAVHTTRCCQVAWMRLR